MIFPGDKECWEKWAAPVEQFREFCQSMGQVEDTDEDGRTRGDMLEETDFHELSLGFFVALGVPLGDAFTLARLARYNFEYWC